MSTIEVEDSEIQAGDTMTQAEQYAKLGGLSEVLPQPSPDASVKVEAPAQASVDRYLPAVLIDRQGEKRESSLPIEIDNATREVCRDYLTEQERSISTIHADLDGLRGALGKASVERQHREAVIQESTPDPSQAILEALRGSGGSYSKMDSLISTAQSILTSSSGEGAFEEASALPSEWFLKVSGHENGAQELADRVEGSILARGGDMRISPLAGKVVELAREKGLQLPLKPASRTDSLPPLPGEDKYDGATNEEVESLLQSAVEQAVRQVVPTKESIVAEQLKASNDAERLALVAELGKVDAKIHQLFRTQIVPSLFVNEADFGLLSAVYDDRNRFVKEAGLDPNWVKDPAEKIEAIRQEQKDFAKNLVPGDTLLIHGTPFIEDIIKDGQLRPSVTKQTEGFNTSRSYDDPNSVSDPDGALGVHFANLSYGSDGYFINKHDGITGGSALVYPLAEIIDQSPVGGARETSLVSSHQRGQLSASWPVRVSAELADAVDQQTERHYEAIRQDFATVNARETDTAFAAGVDIKLDERMREQHGRAFGSPAYEFGYPVEKAHIVILGDRRGEEIRTLLAQSGYTESWVASHLHVVHNEKEVIPLGKEIQAGYKQELGRTMIAPLCDVDERNQPIFSRS